jgi:hypothetical protein
MKLSPFLMAITLSFSSCLTDDVNVKMGYLETQCADPWAEFGYEISDIKAFFEEEERDVDARSIKRNKMWLMPSN